tara:strand:+ start:309 stop:665 length:357 start_codon:yes stop_codon:yes gene_type:complete
VIKIKETSSQRLKKSRENAGLSLTGLSKKTGGEILPSRISNYEQGTRQLPVDVAASLSKHLGVSTSYLLGLDDEYSSKIENLGENQKELFAILTQVSLKGNEEASKVYRMIKAYLDSN